ncbi:DoxX family protein [Sulfitobacter sabulilitoris]|uniref:DoxX family membrane protein n=1 Tax=Sulfitobacter sabulilitoris TaxID=2562655 RepID=A0A5S3PJN0_9RHOB|nr:DoxX family membrane protein [Sulfitobacter sabulilitoris]TMM54511.1 hypothetical protein FDT80_02645 [Sulfitobacter sabulilitoris]
MTAFDRRDATATLILRLGLSWFMFLWAAHKIITPAQYQGLARHFDGLEIALWQVYLVAAVQIVLCTAMALGALRPVSYGALALMHAYTVSRRWEGFLDPFAVNGNGFPVNRNQVIDLAVMAAFVALVLLIHRDRFSLGGWMSHRMGARWWQ